jgi:hypothetical protein
MTAENPKQQATGEVFLVDIDVTEPVAEEGLRIDPSNPAVVVAQQAAAEPQSDERPHRRRLGEEGTPAAEGTPTAEPQAQKPTGRPKLSETKPVPSPPKQRPQARIDPAKAESLIANIRAEQKPTMGIVAGAGAAVVGAIIWATITVVTEYQIAWMAIGMGCLVGGAVRVAGKGIDKSFGYVGAVLSLLGCVLGNLLCICAFVARQEGVPLSGILLNLNLAAVPGVMAATFDPIDLLFYGLAIYCGYRLAFRNVTQEDVARVTANEVSAPDAGQ